MDGRELAAVPPAEARVGFKDLLASAPTFGFAALFSLAWAVPATLGADRINWLFWTFIIEFLVVHSTGFMAASVYSTEARAQRLRSAALFGFPYLVLTIAFAAAMQAWWPLVSFWSLTLNRWAGPLVGQAPPEQTRELVMVGWVVNMAIYCVVVPLAVVAPLPEFGFAEYPVRLESATNPDEVQLHRWMAAAACYFTLGGISELFRHRWVPARWRRGIERSTRLAPRGAPAPWNRGRRGG